MKRVIMSEVRGLREEECVVEIGKHTCKINGIEMAGWIEAGKLQVVEEWGKFPRVHLTLLPDRIEVDQ